MNARPAMTRALLATGLLAVAHTTACGQEPAPSPSPTPSAAATPPAAAANGDSPFGLPVAGHPNYVRSPYAPDAGFIDVSGFKRGQEVRCPYTNLIFLVP